MEWSTGGIANKRQKNVGKFYHSSLFKMARCWAKVPNIDWERIRDPLFNQCPQPPFKDQETQQLHKNKRNAIENKNWVFTAKSRDAILALGIFLLESDGKLAEHILPYFLQVEEGLIDANIQGHAFENKSKLIKEIRDDRTYRLMSAPPGSQHNNYFVSMYFRNTRGGEFCI